MKMEAKQITIRNDGVMLYQPVASNPLPGLPVAYLRKGDHVLKPVLEMIPAALLTAEQAADALRLNLDTVLAPLAGLHGLSDEVAAPVKAICSAVYEGTGIVDREAVQVEIAALDSDMRTFLRNKGVRLGPILLFCPDLNKPAAVRLRAVLYALYHGMTLPAPVVPDGMVSQVVEADELLKGFYRAISYPVYGRRAIRIDMLDRVVNLVYELADKGQFKAQHQMAEWLGCPIADLYAVLEEMGHVKISEPADQPPAEFAEIPEEVAVKAPDSKPELATFRLKKGKAYQSAAPVRAEKPKFKKADKKAEKPHKPKKPFKKKEDEPRIMSAKAAPVADEDSPWAALAALKK
jgi:ATP-dependent RNA helicase SUPV3L1/SUV3